MLFLHYFDNLIRVVLFTITAYNELYSHLGGDEVMKVSDYNMSTDIQFKDELRKELIMYKEYLKLLQEDRREDLEQKFKDNIERIEASLQD